ncbi:MAG: DNA-binding transcriptional regulator OxyR [Pseudoxanthomonas suwonensis]|nr:DNA-binding transcriptional regulator OxyR [Pseudoxanthomonas suwonensis]
MNLRDLRYLVALAEHRHFGKAATASFVSQPTLSTQIRKLEDELGVTLVERAPRKVMLTPVGVEIARRAGQILADVDSLRDLARRSLDPETGSLRLGVFPTLGPYLLPHIVPRLHRCFPRLELLLVEEKSDVLMEQLRQGKLDAALLALPIHDEQLQATFLFEEPFLLAAPQGHALAEAGELHMAQLDEETLLLLEDGHCLRDQALDVCRLAGANERGGFRATSLETLRQMVAADVGLTLLPALSVAPPVVQPEGLALVPFAAPAPHRRIALTWRKSSAMTGLLERVGDEIADAARTRLATVA